MERLGLVAVRAVFVLAMGLIGALGAVMLGAILVEVYAFIFIAPAAQDTETNAIIKFVAFLGFLGGGAYGFMRRSLGQD